MDAYNEKSQVNLFVYFTSKKIATYASRTGARGRFVIPKNSLKFAQLDRGILPHPHHFESHPVTKSKKTHLTIRYTLQPSGCSAAW